MSVRPEIQRLAYRPREIAELLSVSERTVRAWIAAGTLRAVRRGRVVLVPKHVLDAFLNSRA